MEGDLRNAGYLTGSSLGCRWCWTLATRRSALGSASCWRMPDGRWCAPARGSTRLSVILNCGVLR